MDSFIDKLNTSDFEKKKSLQFYYFIALINLDGLNNIWNALDSDYDHIVKNVFYFFFKLSYK